MMRNIYVKPKKQITYLGIVCNLGLKGLPNLGIGCSSGVADVGKLTVCPFVLGTSRCVGLMHTCRL